MTTSVFTSKLLELARDLIALIKRGERIERLEAELAARNSVFLLWDNSRAEHAEQGEGPELVDVYQSRDSALTARNLMADYGEISEDQDPEEISEIVEEATNYFSIEERKVRP